MAKITRGVRNNNPGNIEKGSAWQGLATHDEMTTEQRAETRFAVFKSPEWGIRALAVVLITYQDKRQAKDGSKIDTVQEFIERWAPPSENNTRAYWYQVAYKMGVGANQYIDVHDYNVIKPMVQAIIAHENSGYEYPDELIDKGLMLAGIKPPTRRVVNKTADTAKTVSTVAGGVIGASTIAELVNQASPAIPIISQVATLPWYVFATIAGVTVAGLIYWVVTRKR